MSVVCYFVPYNLRPDDLIVIIYQLDVIINTGRGKLIHTEDLIKGLKSGKVGYAGLDVYEEESELFFTDKSDFILNDDILARLLTFNNVIVTSHQAFFTQEAVSNIVTTTLQNIKDFFLNLK